jgi:hypothetical protein
MSSLAVFCLSPLSVGLSLNHLTNGVSIVTGVGHQSSLAMAVGIDLGFVQAIVSFANPKESQPTKIIQLLFR